MTDKKENKLMVIDNKLQEFGYGPEVLAELCPEEKNELAEALRIDVEMSSQGFTFKPVEIKIAPKLRKFSDPFGEVFDKLKGKLIYKERIRGYWEKGKGKIPACSSIGCKIGIVTETGEEVSCATCPRNKWGTAVDDAGNPTRGKACPEKRLTFLEVDGYEMPVMLRIPTTSITEFDNYFSTRRTKGILDIQKGIEIDLEKAEAHDFEFAKCDFSLGEDIPPKKILELTKKRSQIKDYVENSFQMTADDEYTDGETVDVDTPSNVKLDEVM